MRLISNLLAFGVVALFAVTTAVPLQAQTATVTGRVTDQATGNPVTTATVALLGINRETRTDANGSYRFTNVPIGPIQIQVVSVGYSQQTATVNLAAAQEAVVDFELRTVIINLDAVVVTATGEQRMREVSNAITTVDAASVAEEQMPVSVASLIQGRSPGVQIINTSGTTGSSTKIRIRGSSSISLSNEPLLVVDGVRVDNRQDDQNIGVGGQTISRLNDFNPDDIESIDIVKGP